MSPLSKSTYELIYKSVCLDKGDCLELDNIKHIALIVLGFFILIDKRQKLMCRSTRLTILLASFVYKGET